MSAKTSAEVVIDGKVYTLSGYEGEEYLQKVASYINGKINEFTSIEEYRHIPLNMKNTLIQLNIADDYFKAKDQVMEIEQDLFHVPWTKEGFFTFLTRDDAMFLVVEEKEKILGYCGLLMVLDEGDITNVAVRRDRQKEGIGAFLMQSLIRLAAEREVTTIHLEVRVGNETAIRLYERMGFTGDGIRKAYYSDPVEDALLMTRHPE